MNEKRLPRYEEKFLISLSEMEKIKNYLEEFCEHDVNGVDGNYLVNSIYFDTKDYTSLKENLEGEYEKTKYRLRFYNANRGNMISEIKHKQGNISVKTTSKLNEESFKSLKLLTEKNYNSFISAIYQKHLEPKLYIQYKRYALTAKRESNIRITFDNKIRHSLVSDNFGFSNLKDFEMKEYILEVKYSEPTFWILKLLADLKEKKVSFSKYCNVLTTYIGKSYNELK